MPEMYYKTIFNCSFNYLHISVISFVKKERLQKISKPSVFFLSYSWYPSAKSTSSVREDNRHIYIVLYIHTYTHSYVVMRANKNVLNFLWRSCWCPFFCCFCPDYKTCFIWNWQFFGIENTNKSFIYSAISSPTGCICFLVVVIVFFSIAQIFHFIFFLLANWQCNRRRDGKTG